MSDSLLKQARDIVRSSLKPSEDDIIAVDYILSIALSNFLPGEHDPLWGWLIGPPGSMKTELLRSFNKHDKTVLLSTLTPNSLISGYERQDGKDFSLLPKFNGKIVVIKEFTSVIGLPESQLRQIFGDLRGIFDGFHAKGLGTVGIAAYTSFFSLIAAVTPHIDKFTLVHNDLGERFLSLRICRGRNNWQERSRLARHVWNAAATKAEWRQAIRDIMHKAISTFATTDLVMPSFTEPIIEKMIELADLLSLLRTFAVKDDRPAEPEMPTRTVQQLKIISAGRCLADGRTEVDDADVTFVKRIVVDSLQLPVSQVLLDVYTQQIDIEGRGYIPFSDISKRTGLAVAWIVHLAKQYQYSGVFNRGKQAVRLTDQMVERLKKANLF